MFVRLAALGNGHRNIDGFGCGNLVVRVGQFHQNLVRSRCQSHDNDRGETGMRPSPGPAVNCHAGTAQ